MGVPFPGVTGPMVALVEFLGGIALLIGLLTRLAELGLDAHDGRRHHAGAPERWVLQPEGFEFPLALAAASLAVVFTGRGRILPRSRAGQAPGALSMPQNQ